ncbi:hypothetical protein RB195_011730 [Necator americanus]|uniref:Uncharacterized protein n=1 Tax=Necator americanus TaxID=51031 RepID=A0ABR1D4U4_NECAM
MVNSNASWICYSMHIRSLKKMPLRLDILDEYLPSLYALRMRPARSGSDPPLRSRFVTIILPTVTFLLSSTLKLF